MANINLDLEDLGKNIEDIVNMVDELIDAHGEYMAMYK